MGTVRQSATLTVVVSFALVAAILATPAAAHNFCFYECSVFANAPSDCLRTWYIYSETDFCDSEHKFDSVLRVTDLDGLPSFANSSACEGLSSAQVYGELANTTQHGNGTLEVLGEKDYNEAAYDEYVGWMGAGREQSKCIKWSPAAETYGSWVSDEAGVPVYLSCWERLSCSNAFGFDVTAADGDAAPPQSQRKMLRGRGKTDGKTGAG
ncbi:unnamed protein product [Closterium sp. Yama58-4]|nr:unnamed protein product [Closterium sp. Yama58-4]